MLRVLIILLIEMVIAAPPNLVQVSYPKDNVQLLRYENDDLGTGRYRFGFEQSDGTRHEQEAQLVNEGQEDAYIVMKGVYSWVGPDGVTYSVEYTADGNGFVPSLQQGPGGSIPQDVVRSTG